LKAADVPNNLAVLDTYPLSKYLDISEQLLARFQYAVDQRRLDEAYIYGLRFASLAVESLPKHPEWKHPTTGAKRRQRLSREVEKVLTMMEVLITRMDAEELAKEKAVTVARQKEEALKRAEEDHKRANIDSQRQKEKEQRDALEEERQRYMAQQQSERKKKQAEVNQQKKHNIEESAMAKLLALGAKSRPKEASASTKLKQSREIPSASTDTKEAAQAKSKCTVPGPVSAQSTAKAPKHEQLAKPPSKQSSQKKERSSVTPRQPKMPQKPVKSSNALLVTKESTVPLLDEQANRPAAPLDLTSMDGKTSSNQMATSKTEKLRPGHMQDSSMDNTSNRSISTIQKSTIVEERRRDEIETQLATDIKSKQSSSGGESSRYMLLSPATAKEKRIIDLLQQNIDAQERRLDEIENVQIPFLLKSAKAHLKDKNKSEALKCAAHKKRLEQQVDVIKASVFNMETQLFMLENAMEDRHVKKALNEAASAISGLQQSIGDPNAEIIDLTQMNISFPSADEMDYETDEDLMEELQDWVSPEERRKKAAAKDSDGLSILSLPSVPDSLPSAGSTREILRAVLGT
jgi:hypothetical protein